MPNTLSKWFSKHPCAGKLLSPEPLSENYLECLTQDLKEAKLVRFVVAYVSEKGLEAIGLKNIKATGLMTLGPTTKEPKATTQAFKLLRKTKERLSNQLPNDKKLTELSMGMSGDYEIAIQQGSTMVRLGTALFGRRF